MLKNAWNFYVRHFLNVKVLTDDFKQVILVNWFFKVFPNIRLGYSYDMAITRIHYHSLGTHEIMMTLKNRP